MARTQSKSGSDRRRSRSAEGKEPLKVAVQCMNNRCEEHGKQKEVAAGIVVGDGVMMTGSLHCTACGFAMPVLAGVMPGESGVSGV